jgi:membrane-bound serine protease (ClpP class)
MLDPNVAYLLLVAGFVLGILALFSPGTGILEIGALFALAIAGFGIVNLDINVWALALLILSILPFALSLRKKRNWLFLLLSIAALIIGSVFVFRGPEGGPAVHPLLVVVTSILAFTILWIVGSKGIEAISRQPNFDLDRLVGMEGEARTDIHREGSAYVHGEEWSARSDQTIWMGSRLRVVGREGLTLLVEPLRENSSEPVVHQP